jgi:hypothetical protein
MIEAGFERATRAGAASMKIGDIAVAVQLEGGLPAPSQTRSVAST